MLSARRHRSWCHSKRRWYHRFLPLLVGGISIIVIGMPSLVSAAEHTLRVGTLKFGTVNWQINVIKQHGLDKKRNLNIDIIPLASKNAAAVAIQGGGVDVMVSDWFWVSRQRSQKKDYTFSPYSTAAGGVIASPRSRILELDDLEGKTVGIAGGKIDKSWLILRAYTQKFEGRDLDDSVETVYGAPPLLSKLFERGDLDAILTFWHYGARLRAKGAQQIISIHHVLEKMGIPADIPINGWVFRDSWAHAHPQAIAAFLDASREASDIMAHSDAEWQRLALDVMTEQDRVALTDLRDAYRAGIPSGFSQEEVDAAARLYALLGKIGGKELIGDTPTLSPGTFWPPSVGNHRP